MTQDDFPKTFKGKFIEWGKIAGAAAAIGAFFTLIWGWLGPIRTLYEEWNEIRDAIPILQEQFQQIKDTQDGYREILDNLESGQAFIQTTLDEATRPEMIFETNVDLSGPRDGYCKLNSSCIIDVRIRRTPEGLSCAIVPGSERFYFVEADSGARVQVFRESGTPTTNIGRDWFDYHWSFQTPSQLIEPSGFMYEFTYTNCRGPDDNAQIVQESALIPIQIYTPEEIEALPLRGRSTP